MHQIIAFMAWNNETIGAVKQTTGCHGESIWFSSNEQFKIETYFLIKDTLISNNLVKNSR